MMDKSFIQLPFLLLLLILLTSPSADASPVNAGVFGPSRSNGDCLGCVRPPPPPPTIIDPPCFRCPAGTYLVSRRPCKCSDKWDPAVARPTPASVLFG
ncbi:hypothetical protein Hamer_G001196 [Homarus americanus]|uniref:Uncharacterized protein n=1 Tax=Homarus americanus TaxID=6706 RepID=A0A8J5TH67_HOMAM|nr:hypothetical protein Hamer_G001196 [Homarus americanus]